MHSGDGKQWYGIPGSKAKAFKSVMEKLMKLRLKECPDLGMLCISFNSRALELYLLSLAPTLSNSNSNKYSPDLFSPSLVTSPCMPWDNAYL